MSRNNPTEQVIREWALVLHESDIIYRMRKTGPYGPSYRLVRSGGDQPKDDYITPIDISREITIELRDRGAVVCGMVEVGHGHAFEFPSRISTSKCS
jgi:hypothetical protein